MSIPRRKVSFDSFDAVLRDAEHLLAVGYDRAGKWSLSKCCGHLSAWLRYPVTGFPNSPLPIRLMMALIRPTLGKKMLRSFLQDGMPAGKPTIPQSVPAEDTDERQAVEELRAVAELFRSHTGEYLPSPLFGQLDRDEALKVQLAHCAHHLSFLIPKTTPATRE